VKSLDRYLRDERIARAKRFVRQGDVVLDVGCADGVMFKQWAELIGHGIGVDPILTEVEKTESYELYPGLFPEALPPGVRCDLITMLAVLEHIQPEEQAKLADVCYDMLNDRGRIVVTVPSPRVDDILHVLDRLHLIDGMSVHEHYGFEPGHTPGIFPPPRFKLIERKKFQLGLNNLFVFEKA
jgi:2-polyprenyl-3-methyl-5-hydroxy-6-metoxy-1,4-benzoquinol methylase